jgi:CubicO group peptidase (beta-lactamase class C family)
MLKIISVLAAIALLAPSADRVPQTVGPAIVNAEGIDAVLRAAIDRMDVPAVAAVALNRRGIVYRGAFGMADVAAGQPMRSDAIFRIASMTKPVTSIAAMQLMERGVIGLDDAVERYLPVFSNVSVVERFDARTGKYAVRAARRAVTIRHLLTHTSGLGYAFTSPVLRDFKPHGGERYEVGPLLFDPGEQWLYGTSTDWLGRLVESVSGQTLDSYFREHIFVPLGMTDTFFNVPDDKQARVVTAHRRQPDGSLVEQPRQSSRPVTQFNGGGGLSSTAGDYARLLQMLLGDGQSNGTRILRAQSVALMAANQIGRIGVPALKTAQPQLSEDFSFIADRRDKWGLGFLITTRHVAGKRSAGSLSWGGLNNTYFWIDRSRGVAGVILMQFLPFADRGALSVLDAFERAVYQFPSASHEVSE